MEIHSGIKASWTRDLFFLCTSDHHDIDDSKLNVNCGSMTNVWDLIFKTEIVEDVKKKCVSVKREITLCGAG